MDVSDPDIRLLTATDLEGAFALSSTAGWNQRLDDWRLLLEIAPGGSFAAVHEGVIVGTAIGIDYGTFGWIAMMLVDPRHRSHGIGARMLEAAMGALPPELPVRLDATPLGRPLYQRYGFEDESLLTRYVREAGDAAGAPPDREGTDSGAPTGDNVEALPDDGRDVRRLTFGDLAAVAQQDNAIFRGTRRIVIEWAFHGAPHYAHVVDSSDGVAQYCLGREGRLFDQIGPVVASDDGSACRLVRAALAASRKRAMVVDGFDANAAFTSWLQERGFKGQRPLYRMGRFGPGVRRDDEGVRSEVREFSILGPEFG